MAISIDTPPTTVDVFDDLAAVRQAVNEIAGHRNAIDGRLVDVAAWLLSNDEWHGTGLHKPEQFLAFRCGIGLAAAKRYVDVARRADELPAAVAALRAGELSLDQVMPIVRRVPDWADDQVVSLSKRLTVGQINAVINRYNFDRSGLTASHNDTTLVGDIANNTEPEAIAQHDPEPETATAQPERSPAPKDRCWMGTGDDGRFRLHLETTPDIGMTIRNAVDEARDRIFGDTGNFVSDAEALADIATRSLAIVGDPARTERFRSNIHLNTDGTATDHLGTPLPPSIQQHITCDGLLTPVFHANGRPISVGRSQHIVPTRTRKAVILRDRGCAVPGCGATRHLEVHHIVHWSRGGPSDTWNLLTLCPHHHRLHHQGRLDISGNADHGTVVFRNEHGLDLAGDGPRPEPPAGPPPAPTGEFVPPLCERLDMHWVAFTHPERLHPATPQARSWQQRTGQSVSDTD